MSERIPVSLVISDIDSTIADKYDTWAFAIDEALDKICDLYQRPREDVVKDLLDYVPEDQRHIAPYIGKDLAADIERTPSLRPQTPEQEKRWLKFCTIGESNVTKQNCMTASFKPLIKSVNPARNSFYIRILVNLKFCLVWQKWALPPI